MARHRPQKSMFTSAGRRAGATGELDLGNILFNYPGFSVGNSDEVYGSGYFGVQDASGSEYGQIGADYTFPGASLLVRVMAQPD
jgi:hypothetical protein